DLSRARGAGLQRPLPFGPPGGVPRSPRRRWLLVGPPGGGGKPRSAAHFASASRTMVATGMSVVSDSPVNQSRDSGVSFTTTAATRTSPGTPAALRLGRAIKAAPPPDVSIAPSARGSDHAP